MNRIHELSSRARAWYIERAKASEDEQTVWQVTVQTVNKRWPTASKIDKQDTAKALYALGLAAHKLAQAETAEQAILAYAAWKARTYKVLNDKGAFGDAIETVVHLIAARKRWRTKIDQLHVTPIGKTDVRIAGHRFEVGHNAKLWADATEDDLMHGPFEGVIYGMIENSELMELMELMETEPRKALSQLADMLYVFEDKDEFLDYMNGGRSNTIKWRADVFGAITVYNGSKANWFSKTVQAPTLREYMLAIGDNDYLE